MLNKNPFIKKVLNIFIFILLMAMYFSYSTIFVQYLKKFNINVADMNIIPKTIILISLEITFILILTLLYRKELKKEFLEYKNNFKKHLLFGFKIWAIGLLIMMSSNIVLYFITHTTANNQQNVYEALKVMPVYMIFATAIYAPFSEEMIFRKVLKKCFANPYVFIIASGLIFGAIHVLSSENFLELLYIIPYGTFGVAFAYMYHKTKTIFTSMTMHFIHNTVLVIFLLLTLGVI